MYGNFSSQHVHFGSKTLTGLKYTLLYGNPETSKTYGKMYLSLKYTLLYGNCVKLDPIRIIQERFKIYIIVVKKKR